MLATAAGCAERSFEDAFSEYHERLSRTLSVGTTETEPIVIAALPPSRELTLDIEGSGIDVLDFLALTGCELQVTIGKRNSSLGRLASASQRLLLELEYLQLAPECIDYLESEGKRELASTLQDAWDDKRAQLPSLIYNATLASPEFRQFWKTPTSVGDYPANTGSGVLNSLAALNDSVRRWLSDDFAADNLTVELLLSDILKGDGGALRLALAKQALALDVANEILAARLARGPLCTPPLRPQSADILDVVVEKFFIAGTQPRAAALNRRYHDLHPAIAELEGLLANVLPTSYRRWQQQRDAELGLWIKAPRMHVDRIIAIQKPCKAGEQIGS
ncbi:MAG: DUF3080 family protein [Pseudomonadota bacterium]